MLHTRSTPSGVWPVMLTPFHRDGSIDGDGVDRLTDWQIAAGAAGLFAVCLSSEMYELDDAERLALAARIVKRAAGRVPVVASGTFGGPVERQAEFARRMAGAGVDAIVCLACQLADADQSDDQWRANVETFLERTGDLPLGLYECPRPYHRVLTPELMSWAASTGRFLFLKETSCRIGLIQAKIAAARGTPFGFYNANTRTLLASLRAGAAGYSGTAANFYPQLCVWLCKRFRDEPDTAERLQRFLTIAQELNKHKYPQSAKEFLARAGMNIGATCRACAHTFDEEEIGKLDVLREEAERWGKDLGLPDII